MRYSTVAEIYHAGVPFGYLARPRFRESQRLVTYIENQMCGLSLSEAEFQDGSWVPHYLSNLLALPRIHRLDPNGAAQAAHFICTSFGSQG